MNPLDALFAVLCGYWALRGWQRGAVREIFAAVGLVAGLFAMPHLSPPIATALLQQGVEPKAFAAWLALPLAFLGVYLACRVVGFGIHRVARIVVPRGVNRGLGLTLGVAKGVVLVAVLILAVERVAPPDWYRDVTAGSRTVPILGWAAHAAAKALGADRWFTDEETLEA